MKTLLPILFTALAIAGCRPTSAETNSDLQVEWSFSPEPLRAGPTTLSLQLSDPAGEPLVGAQLLVEANMNHAGMVPVFGTPTEREQGTYVTPLELTMGGDWFLLVDVTFADGRTHREKIDLPGVLTE